MLSSAKIGTGSWRYYADQVDHGACEYFLGVGEAPGRWYGRGLDQLALTANGRVSERELEALFGRALHPTTGDQLGRGWRTDGVTGYDLCFSAPKTVSVLWALGDDEAAVAVRRAHAAAVRAGLDYLDAHAAYSRTGRDGHAQVGTAGMAAAVFEHRTSRAGDPQLHTHALVVNKVRCADGTWRTIDGHEIYAHKKSAGTIYQAALRGELTRRLGITWTPVSKDGQAEIAGVPAELIRRWSTRTAQVAGEAGPVIAAYEQRLGRPLTSAERTAVTKVAVLKTRPGKEAVDILVLTERWETEAVDLGWTPDRLREAVSRAARPTDPDQAHAELERIVDEAVATAGERKAVFSRADLLVEVTARLPALSLPAEMTRELAERLTDRALTTAEAVPLQPQRDGPARTSDARWASATTLSRELEILDVADRGRGASVAVCPAGIVLEVSAAAGLDHPQRMAVAQLTRGGDRIAVLVAPAGTGKTTALSAATAAWQARGHPVIGLAPSARAARELGTATGLRTETVAKLLYEQREHPERARLRQGSVVIVDEASMLATRGLCLLAALVTAAGGKLVLVGDPAQIGAVDAAGGMLPALADRLAAPSLAEVHRFNHRWERAASLQLRHGDPTALDAYLSAGRVHALGGGADPYMAVLAQYQQLAARGGRVLMLARTHQDADALNTGARAQAINAGTVHGQPLLSAGNREWRAGDRLRATRNHRSIPVGTGDHLRNGDTFTVTGRTSQGLTVQRLDGTDMAVLPDEYVAEHAVYGWAATIDAAQGATVDHTLLLARPGLDRSRLYVGMTRGRESNHLYLAPPPDPEITPRHPAAPPAVTDSRQHLVAMLSTPVETATAHTRLPHPPAEPTPYVRRRVAYGWKQHTATDRGWRQDGPYDRPRLEQPERWRGRGR